MKLDLGLSKGDGDYAIHDAGDPEGVREGGSGNDAGCETRRADDEVQRISPKGRRSALSRWPPPAFDGRARHVFRRKSPGDRRTVRRIQGGRGRLLDDSGQIQGRGGRMGEARADARGRRYRGSSGAGDVGLPSGRSGSRGRITQFAERLAPYSPPPDRFGMNRIVGVSVEPQTPPEACLPLEELSG